MWGSGVQPVAGAAAVQKPEDNPIASFLGRRDQRSLDN